MPVLFLAYVIAYIDRSNLALAKVAMGKDLGLDSATFATRRRAVLPGLLPAGDPGRGDRRALERPQVDQPHHDHLGDHRRADRGGEDARASCTLMRFLLGLAEAGFFPGVIIYLTHWFPDRDRARALAHVHHRRTGGADDEPAAVVSDPAPGHAPRSSTAWRSATPPLWGMTGWQWNFIVWGIPAVLLGIFVLFYLTDRPSQARWLTDARSVRRWRRSWRARGRPASEQRDHLAERPGGR